MTQQQRKIFYRGYFLKLSLNFDEEPNRTEAHLVAVNKRPAEFFLFTPRFEELITLTIPSLNHKIWTLVQLNLSQKDLKTLKDFAMTPTQHLRHKDGGTISFIKTKDSSPDLRPKRKTLSEEIYQNVKATSQQQSKNNGEKQIPWRVDDLFEFENSLSSPKVPEKSNEIQKRILGEIKNGNDILSKQQQNKQNQKHLNSITNDVSMGETNTSKEISTTLEPMMVYANSSSKNIVVGTDNSSKSIVVGTDSSSSSSKGSKLQHPRFRFIKSQQTDHNRKIDETETKKNNNINNNNNNNKERDLAVEEDGECHHPVNEEENEERNKAKKILQQESNQYRNIFEVLASSESQEAEEKETEVITSRMKVPRHPRFNLQKIPLSNKTNNHDTYNTSNNHDTTHKSNNHNTYNSSSDHKTNNHNNHNTYNNNNNNNNTDHIDIHNKNSNIKKTNKNNSNIINNNNNTPEESSRNTTTTTVTPSQSISKESDEIPISKCYEKDCRVLITRINSSTIEEKKIPGQSSSLPVHNDKDYEDPTNEISLENLTDVVSNFFVDVKAKEKSQRRSIERLRKVKEELQVLYDESSAALLEKTKHPKANRQDQGCHDNNTEINQLPSVGEVYDKVNEEYIKRMKDLEKSIEERSQQEIMIERQTMLQEYWKKVQPCINCNRISVVLTCDGCKSVFYCNKKCQRQHWKIEHETKCCSSSP